MKSFALALLLFVLSSGAVRAQTTQAKSELEQSGLAGRVKSLETWRIEYALREGVSVEGRRVLVRKTTYDEQGRKAEDVSYDQSGSPSRRAVYAYDAEGRSTGYDEFSGLLDKSLANPRRHVYKLDGVGRRVEYTVYESDGAVASRFTYAYDAEGNKTEEASYSWNGSRTGKLVYAYDVRGQVLTETSYNADESVSWKSVNVYDSEGRKTESVQYQGERLRYRFFYKYDGKGRLKEQETREFNAIPNVYITHAPEPGRVVYVYDDEKRTKEVAIYDERGTLKSRLAYASAEKGNDAVVTELNPDGSVKSREVHWYEKNVRRRTLNGTPSVEFVYDARGNWTRKTFLIKPADAERPAPYWAEYREFIYY
jgi:hypothetical protein